MSINWGAILLLVPIFLFALTVHEFAHALTAKWGGDRTAEDQKRLTLNPVSHIDLFGTVLIPVLAASAGYIFGWARPIPVNESNFRDKHWSLVVSLAGPYSNFMLAVLGGILLGGFLALQPILPLGADASAWLVNFGVVFVQINLFLMLFNLLPIPPLDGSHIFHHLFIRGHGGRYAAWESYQSISLVVLLVLLLSGMLRHLFGLTFVGTEAILRLTYAWPFGA